MPKLKSDWLWRDNPTFMMEHDARIRQHRKRVESDMERLGIKERATALKVCAVEGCLEETIESERSRLKKWGWLYIGKQWYCPQHSKQQEEC